MLLLIYIVSLNLQSTIYMTIENKCYYIELESPVYFIKDANCHMRFPQQVNSKNIMKANFITGIDQDTFGGALLYHLQRGWGRSNAQLLVIWGYKPDGIYSHTWLIKHENTLVWDKGELRRFHDVYDSQCDAYSRIGEWLVDYGTGMKAKCETSNGGFEMKVTISRESGLLPISPPQVDPNR
jgi:hypothetical protein